MARRWGTFLRRANDGGCEDEYEQHPGHPRHQAADRYPEWLGMAVDHARRAGGAGGSHLCVVALEQETFASSLRAAHTGAYSRQAGARKGVGPYRAAERVL